MSLLTKEEISELIKQKEERDKVFEHEEQERVKETEVIYHRIKDLFLKYVIEESILRGYKVNDHTYKHCLFKTIVETIELGCDPDLLYAIEVSPRLIKDITEYSNKDVKKVFDFKKSYDSLLLDRNLSKFLLSNGFEKDGYLGFKTSKKALLGGSKIPEYIAPPQVEVSDIGLDTKTTGLLTFIGLLVAVSVMCWLKSIY